MDLSDGLCGDLPKLAAASGLAARADVSRLPISDALRTLLPIETARELALAAGDDYELLLAVPPPRLPELTAAAHRLNLTLTAIGELIPGNGVQWLLGSATYMAPPSGFHHFR
jgi:thiamine-monophosphate kinase